MTTAARPISEIAAQWRMARRLYTIYSALLEKFALGIPPSRDLESPIDRNDQQILDRVWKWFAQMDERMHVHQLRQLLQTSKLGTEENLRLLINHYLEQEAKTDSDRDKIDFLLVQYLSSCAPPGFYDREVDFEEVAQVLEPVLGEVGMHAPRWAEPLEEATNSLKHCHGLRDLLEPGTLEKARALKANAGDMYYGPTSLVAITRFNFLVRRAFVRLIAADLHAIRQCLHELEQRGVRAVDCTRAQLAATESIENVRQICHEWKKPFRAAYAAGENFKELMEIRTAVEVALASAPEHAAVSVEAVVSEPPQPHTVSTAESNGILAKTDTGEIKATASALSGVSTAAAPQPDEVSAGLAAVQESQKQREAEEEAARLVSEEARRKKEEEEQRASQPKPEAKAASAAPSLDVQAKLETIGEQLLKLATKEGSVATVVMGDIKVLLSSWEVNAFIKGGDESSDMLQRAVAARLLLLESVERRKRTGDENAVRSAIKLAQLEAAKVQARIAIAKEAKDIDAAVNLAATSKRLLALMQDAEKPLKD